MNLAQRIVVISACAVIAVILLAGGAKRHRWETSTDVFGDQHSYMKSSMDVARTSTLVGSIVAVAVAVAVALGSAQITHAVSLGWRSARHRLWRAKHGLLRAIGVMGLVLAGVSIAGLILWLAWLAVGRGWFGAS